MVQMSFDPNKPYNGLPLIPPKFNFDDVDILKMLNSANMALARLSGLAMSLPNRELLIQSLTVREAVASSGIENINTTVEEVFQAALMDIPEISKAQKETLFYKDSLLAGYEIIQRQGYLNTNSFLNIQSVLEPDKTGIRKIPVSIKNSSTGQVLYTPPVGEDLLRSLLKNYEDYYNTLDDGTDALIKMAILHYQFEAIHPFLDGNGRTGRILMVLYLVLAKRLGMPILFISGYINENRTEYYRLLRDVTVNSNWKGWVLYMLKAVEAQSINTLETVIKIRDLMSEYKERMAKELPKINKAELIDYLFSQPFYTQRQMAKSLNLTKNTVVKYMKLLEEKGFIRVLTDHKENIYFSEKFIEILK